MFKKELQKVLEIPVRNANGDSGAEGFQEATFAQKKSGKTIGKVCMFELSTKK